MSGTMGIELVEAWTERGLAEKFVRYIEDKIIAFQQKTPRQSFVLGLSGPEGKTRREGAEVLFRLLGEKISADKSIDWSRVCVFLVEERWSVAEEETNSHLVRTALTATLQRRGVVFSDDQFILPNLKLETADMCAKDYEDRVLKLFKDGGPHLVTLSLGSDLSVAGISPEWYNRENDNWAQTISKSLKVLHTDTFSLDGPHRICVNLAIIRRARNILVDVNESYSGTAWKSVSQAFSSASDASALEYQDDALGRSRSAQRDERRPARAGSASFSLEPPGTPQQRGMMQRSNMRAQSYRQDSLDMEARRKNSPLMQPGRPGSPRGTRVVVPISPLIYIMKYKHITVAQRRVDEQNVYTVVILGAGGDLAKKKTFPALFQLQVGNHLPPSTHIIGCDDPGFHEGLTTSQDLMARLRPFLEKESGWMHGNIDGKEGDSYEAQDFMKRIEFMPVKLTEPGSMSPLHMRILELARSHKASLKLSDDHPLNDNRIFYLALPSKLFPAAVERIRTECWSDSGARPEDSKARCRVIVEKPFGRSLKEARDLAKDLGRHLQENQIFRIDHYLAKTLILNILTLRFANREFGTLFHNYHVANVRITFQEDIDVEGRAGYFDEYGIIRDIMQNHLMQVLTLIAMEAPASLEAEDVRNEKVKVLKQIRPIRAEDCVIGQYDGYQDDPQIKKINEKHGYASRCPTFAVAVLYLDNERWSNVPFIMKAGKGLQKTQTLVRIQFRKAPSYSIFGDQPQNEMVICIQPKERIYYKMLAKMPGISQKAKDVRRTNLDLDLKTGVERVPLAYEKLIYDVIQGDSHNFVRRDELEEAWRIFDPLLRELEDPEPPRKPIEPFLYAKGSGGPKEADELIQAKGFQKYTPTGVAVSGFSDDEVA